MRQTIHPMRQTIKLPTRLPTLRIIPITTPKSLRKAIVKSVRKDIIYHLILFVKNAQWLTKTVYHVLQLLQTLAPSAVQGSTSLRMLNASNANKTVILAEALISVTFVKLGILWLNKILNTQETVSHVIKTV